MHAQVATSLTRTMLALLTSVSPCLTIRRAPLLGHSRSVSQGTMLRAEAADGDLLGSAALEVCRLHDGAISCEPVAVARPLLSGMIVQPSHRRRGVASALLTEAEAQAAAWGFDEVVLNVQRSNSAATELYARRGYSADSEASEHIDVDSLSWWGRWQYDRSYVLLRKELAPDAGLEAYGSDARVSSGQRL